MKMQLPQSTVDRLNTYRRAKEAWINAPFGNCEKERKTFEDAKSVLASSIDLAYKIFCEEDKILPGAG